MNRTQEIAEATNLAAGIAYDQLLRCVHCGLCTSACPTYLETGDENNGPRGRIQLIRMVADGHTELTDRMERHLELCLDCRACESVCPSGVQYGRLIEPFRQAIEEKDNRMEKRWDLFRRWIVLSLFPYADRLRRVLGPIRLMQRLGCNGDDRPSGIVEAPARPFWPLGPALAAAGASWPAVAEIPACGRPQAGPRGVLCGLRG